MARIRSIKPDFWVDEKIVTLSFAARLLFIGLWNFADDDGRMVYSPHKIKMQIFPADSLDISELFGEIRRESLVVVYKVGEIEYLQILHFSRHQKIDKRSPSKLPAYESGVMCENKDLDNTVQLFPPNPPESPRIPTTEGKGREGNKSIGAKPAPSREDDFEKAWTRYPARSGSNPKKGALACWHARIAEGVKPEDLLAATERYRAFCDATAKTGTEFVMQAKRFFGKGGDYTLPWALPAGKPAAVQRPEPPMPKPFPRSA